jgi:hypothetical protein
MNPILTTIIAAFNTNTEVDSSSIRTMYNTMPMYESMIIDGDTITKELKRTPRGVFVRNLKNGDSIVHYGEGYENRPSDVISSQKWTRLANPEQLELQKWLTGLDTLNSYGGYCGRDGSERFTVYVGTEQLDFRSSDCKWDAQDSFATIFEPATPKPFDQSVETAVAEHIAEDVQ